MMGSSGDMSGGEVVFSVGISTEHGDDKLEVSLLRDALGPGSRTDGGYYYGSSDGEYS